MNKNVIAFQKGFIVVPELGIDNRLMAMTAQSELMQFGYMLTDDAFKQLSRADAADIKQFYTEVIQYLREITGGLRNYKPVYPGFPQQVMEMSEYELWINQLIGYFGTGTFNAREYPKVKGTAFEHVKYKMITDGNEEKFHNIFKNLASSGQSLTENDSKVIQWFIENYPDLEFPEIIPFKENLCSILGKLVTLNRIPKKLPKLTTTDVLRIIVFLSNGDVSLPKVPRKYKKISTYRRTTHIDNPEREKFKFKKFNRKERKFLIYLLDNSNLDIREMKLKVQRWIRIGEILHPGEYAEQYPRVHYAFQKIRNDKVSSWYGEVNRAFKSSFEIGLIKLSERPGEFMRRLDFLLRNNPSKVSRNLILSAFSVAAMKTSNKVLFEVYEHFERRRTSYSRSIMPKGSRKRITLKTLEPFHTNVVDAIQSKIWEVIKDKFKSLPALGDCWIDEDLKKIPLPTNMRSLNDSLVPAIRGERIPLFPASETNVLRCFIHWFDQRGSLDIDLHGYLLGDTAVHQFGYNAYHNSNFGCYSGDVRHRRGACAEYVDIKLDETRKMDIKYFIMIAHNFNGESFENIPECVAGMMQREYPEKNSSWLPSTITQSIRLKSNNKMCLVGIVDLTNMEYIHLDIDYGDADTYINGGGNEFIKYIKQYVELPKLSVYDLMLWHVESRGRLVSKETADTHFLFEDFSGSYTKTLEYLGV